jgi:hypothetical protein
MTKIKKIGNMNTRMVTGLSKNSSVTSDSEESKSPKIKNYTNEVRNDLVTIGLNMGVTHRLGDALDKPRGSIIQHRASVSHSTL